MGGNVSALWHVEVVHPDPDAAASFLREVFGAEQVEGQMSSHIESVSAGARIIHMKLGGVVFQFVKPGPGAESWQKLLDSNGPCVHNITLLVDGLEEARDNMIAKGCQEISRFDVRLQDAGLDVTGQQRAYLIDAMAQIGLRIEMLETIPGWTPGEGP
ncbi:MAG: hypothetical protein CL908_14870 [Deltaproteobacteria bacterium]|nr:hypothetical protein [Deltaproteobacteria bacterium]